MKRLTLLPAAMIAATGMLQAQGYYQEIGSGFLANSVSPNGVYVVGYGLNASDDDAPECSYRFNTVTRQIEWLTEKSTDLLKCGSFFSVNDNGDVVGMGKDPSVTYTVYNEKNEPVDYPPLNVPVIWKNGARIQLPIGPYKPEDFKYAGNGLAASTISADGKVIGGYIFTGTSTNAKNLVRWYYNEATGAYDFQEMPAYKESNYFGIQSIHASADGSILLAEAKLNGLLGYRAFLIYDENCEVTEFDPFGLGTGNNAYIYDLSPSGQYVLFSAYDRNQEIRHGVYDLKNKRIEWEIPVPSEIDETYGCSIDDNANGYLQCDSQLYYFNRADGLCFKASGYFKSFESGITDLGSGVSAGIVYDLSADGRIIAGNTGSYSEGNNYGWIISLPDEKTVNLNSVSGLEVYYSSPTKVTGRWSPLVPQEGITISQYRVSLAGTVQTLNVDELTIGPDKKYFFTADGTPGTVVPFSVVAITEVNGKKYESVPSTTTCAMPLETGLFFFEDFNDALMDSYGNLYYQGDAWYPLDTHYDYVQLWHLDNGMYSNDSPTLMMQSLCDNPWDVTILSRWFDASEQSADFYFTYYLLNKSVSAGVGFEEQAKPKKTDIIELQWSEDGFIWNTLQSFNAEDYTHNNWNFQRVDLNMLKGKVFQLRFRASGNGSGYLRWYVDNTGIILDRKVSGPEGLVKSVGSTSGVDLDWKNSLGAYEFSYLRDHPVVAEQQLGNEGKPLQIAIAMDADQSKKYAGLSVKTMTMLYYDGLDSDGNPKTPSYVEGIVYEDGKELTRVEFPPCETDVTLWAPVMCVFDNPVTIKAGKEYIFAVNIENDDPTVAPIWYQNHDSFIGGKSDLYSENGGKTWNWMSEFYSDEQKHEVYGKAIWPIRVGLQAPEESLRGTEYDSSIYGWNLYRNGEKVNQQTIFFNHPRYHDEAGTIDSEYKVVAYYADGNISEQSVAAKKSGVEELALPADADVEVDGSAIRVSGEYAEARVISLDGRIMARSHGSLEAGNLPAGIYLIEIRDEEGNVHVRRTVVR